MYLNGDGLVVFETAKAVLRFQWITLGILGRVEGGSRQIFSAHRNWRGHGRKMQVNCEYSARDEPKSRRNVHDGRHVYLLSNPSRGIALI